MKRRGFLEGLQSLAPLELAEAWDNVGVLVDPGLEEVRRVLLTIDLTPSVLQEADNHGCDAIIAYHPVIFSGMKRVVTSDPKGHLVVSLLRRGILVYSPHTALDSVEGGVNDFLLGAFDVASRRPVQAPPNAPLSSGPFSSAQGPGQGRVASLVEPLDVNTAVARVKAHLALPAVRVSRPTEERPIRTVAVCAGAGGSVLMKCEADLMISGEMRHHDVLDLQQRGTAVILTDHTNSERGYLPLLQRRLAEVAPELEIFVSAADADPLRIE